MAEGSAGRRRLSRISGRVLQSLEAGGKEGPWLPVGPCAVGQGLGGGGSDLQHMEAGATCPHFAGGKPEALASGSSQCPSLGILNPCSMGPTW